MKHYIMLSYITSSGGVQCYTAAKARYLEADGWHVVVISDNDPKANERCLISALDKYLPNGNPYQKLHACHVPMRMVKKALERYLEVIGHIEKDDEVIVESYDDKTALWGELLASRIHGRHMFWTANEHYRFPYQCYKEKIDFFMFKMDRGEILASINGANKLFKGYRTYEEGDFLESFITEDPVLDIDNPVVNSIVKTDWNICYIGRSNKHYVPNIFEGVGRFAVNHPDKIIQFLVVGEVIDNKDALESIKNIDNLKVIELGDLYPLPRSLYSKIDVVIAGSGSARHSMDEGVLVITADVFMMNSHGLLGYDTNESIEKEEGSMDLTFDEALERALVEKIWMQQENKWIKNPGIKDCTERQFEIIKNASPELNYYDEKKLLEGKIDYYGLLTRAYVNCKSRIKKMIQ